MPGFGIDSLMNLSMALGQGQECLPLMSHPRQFNL
jgi:hypothetical protein